MKKLLLLLMCNIGIAQQLDFGDTEYTTISITIEPSSSIKEKSLNATFEFQYSCHWLYIKPSVQILPSINYVDTAVGLGILLDKGYYQDWVFYSGIRLGYIHRGVTYPLFGFEGGFDRKITNNVYIGLRATYDWREDFEFSGANAQYQFNGGIKLTYKF